MPFFHFQSIFGYAPLPYLLNKFWAIYDNNINTVTSLHMLYMSYVSNFIKSLDFSFNNFLFLLDIKVRLRSLQSPKNFEKELLIKYPVITMTGFWLSGLATWAPIVFNFGLNEYTLNVHNNSALVTSIINCES